MDLRVVHQLDITPKAFANFSPRLERSDNLGIRSQKGSLNPERVRQLPNPFRVWSQFKFIFPGLSLRSNPGLELANAFGVIQIDALPN